MTQIVTVTLPSEIVYVSGTVNDESVVWTLVDTVWQTAAARTSDDTYNVALTAIDAAGNTSAISMTLFYGVLSLVTDRVGGFYNASDLNRVGAAALYLSGKLREYGYAVTVNPKLDWTMRDIPCVSDMAVYLADITAIREAFAVLEITPDVPPDMDFLTAEEANDIEKILRDVDILIGNMTAVFVYSGEIYGGEII